MVILVTGFEAFGKWEVNPTAIAMDFIDGKSYYDHEIVGRVLPLRYKEIKRDVDSLIQQFDPSAVIHTGQAGGDSIRLERNAVNKASCPVPYNCGTLVENEILVANGTQSISSSLPINEIFNSLNSNNIKVKYSESAGTFGCNQVFYLTRYYYPHMISGFIHVPLLPEQATGELKSMPQETINHAIDLSTEIVAKKLQITVDFNPQ